jgi:hypothetical protein
MRKAEKSEAEKERARQLGHSAPEDWNPDKEGDLEALAGHRHLQKQKKPYVPYVPPTVKNR